MLTKDELDFLSKIPEDKKVHIYPFDPRIIKIAEDIVQSINRTYSNLEVKHMGASALEISGQNDIDVYAFSDPKDFGKYLPGLIKFFGEPLHRHKTFCEWKFNKDGFDIEFYLTAKDSETMQKQIKVFETLRNSPNLLKEYEKLKSSMSGKSFKEYQEKKYEFYHKILGSNEFVKTSYNRIAKDYSATRDQFKNLKYLEKLNTFLKPKSKILDIGCGAGVPIDKYFIEKGHNVIGIDISSEQIKLAKKNIPEGHFEIKDMSFLKENEFTVNAVVSFYAIFHIPRERHSDILKKIYSFLPIGGLILITMGASEWEGIEEFHGTKMFWSHYGPEKNTQLITDTGFEILSNEVDNSSGEKHLIILARKT